MTRRRGMRVCVPILAIGAAFGAPSAGDAAFGDVDTTFGDPGSAPLAGTPSASIATGRVSIVPDAAGVGIVGSTGDGRRDVLLDMRHTSSGAVIPDSALTTPVGVGAQAGFVTGQSRVVVKIVAKKKPKKKAVKKKR